MKVTLIIGAVLLIAAPSRAQEGMSGAAPSAIPPPGPDLSLMSSRPRTTPSPGTEQALRHQIEALEAGQADYDAMTADAAAQARYQSEKTQAQVHQWGALRSLSFVSVSKQGWDVYEAVFEHARVQWAIGPLGALNKITSLRFIVVSPS